jgi:hypothetical protein
MPKADADGRRGDQDGDDAASGPGGSRKLTKAELRRAARKRREAEWAAFNASRPDESYENPDDLAAIEAAERDMGDCKLKSDPDYAIAEVRLANVMFRWRMASIEAGSVTASRRLAKTAVAKVTAIAW